MLEIPNLSIEDTNRFWSKVAITAREDLCWEWTGHKKENGCGTFSLKDKSGAHKMFLSPRVSYFITNNEDPFGFLVCHHCDNPKCVNPKHIYKGTPKTNADDMVNRNRHPRVSGTKHGMSKIDEKAVLDIREKRKSGMSEIEIAEMYKVHRSQINKIVRKIQWAHVK